MEEQVEMRGVMGTPGNPVSERSPPRRHPDHRGLDVLRVRAERYQERQATGLLSSRNRINLLALFDEELTLRLGQLFFAQIEAF